MKTDLLSMTREELSDYVTAAGYPAYRARQISTFMLSGRDIGEMGNLPAAMRAELGQVATAAPVSIMEVYTSALDGTEKYLYRLEDGNVIEGVLMSYRHGNTLCLSTQVGCRMGCLFCASTLDGCVRNLSAGELLGQITAVNRRLGTGGRVNNVVLMGSGEPLDNYDNVVKFLRLMSSEEGLNMSLRGVSLSTCGLTDKVRKFTAEKLPITLCLSLHAPNDDLRARIMPTAAANPLIDLVAAFRDHVKVTGRRVIFEYALIEGMNDSLNCARALASLLRGFQCHLNVIPINEIPERQLRAPGEGRIRAFIKAAEQGGLSVTRRREMGADISGACGQLRRSAILESQGGAE